MFSFQKLPREVSVLAQWAGCPPLLFTPPLLPSPFSHSRPHLRTYVVSVCENAHQRNSAKGSFSSKREEPHESKPKGAFPEEILMRWCYRQLCCPSHSPASGSQTRVPLLPPKKFLEWTTIEEIVIFSCQKAILMCQLALPTRR